MGYPIVIYNPQRPQAGFTLQDYMAGVYLDPTGGTITWDSLRTYVLSGFSSLPSSADVKTAQAALGLSQSGELDSDTMAAVVNEQLAAGLTPTGVPDGPTLAAITSALRGTPPTTGTPPAGGAPKRRPDYSGAIAAGVLLLIAKLFIFED